MGKSQKKCATRRHNPTRVPDSHLPKGLGPAESSSTKGQVIIPIIQKLESPDSQDRIWACAAVSNLIQNDPSTRRLLQGKNIVGSLITRLSDTVEEVVVEAAGALRNLCIDGGHEICAEMYNKNILAPLKSFVPKISTTLSQLLENPQSAPEGAQRLVYEFSENVITLFWCLAETSNKALNAVNKLSLVPFLVSFLSARDRLPLATVVAAAQCLFVLSDDNDVVCDELRGDSTPLACLLDVAKHLAPVNGTDNDMKVDAPVGDPEWLTTLQLLAAGILRNLGPLPPLVPAAAVDLDSDIILPLVVPVLSISLPDECATIESLLSQPSEPAFEKLSLKHTPKSDHLSPAERDLNRIEMKLRSVQLALEILTGVCATLPDPEPIDETEDGDVDGNMDDDHDDTADLEMEMEAHAHSSVPNGDAHPAPNSGVPPVFAALVPLLVALAQPTRLSFPPPASSTADTPVHPPTTTALGALHVRAFECLNNLFLALDVRLSGPADVAGARAVWAGVWAALRAAGGAPAGKLVEPDHERRHEMWDVGVGVLWGVSRAVRGHLDPEEQEVKALMELCDASEDDAFKVKCIGTLESLAQKPDAVAANKVIATYLLSMLASASSGTCSTEAVLQAASAMIDIYADEDLPYDINFREARWVEALQTSVQPLRKLVRGIDRRKEGGRELRWRGDEVLENLVAFVRYRQELGF